MNKFKTWLTRIPALPGFFFVGAVFAALLLMVGHGNVLYFGADQQFHYNRIYELYRNIQHGNFFPTISTYSANQIGSNVIAMYPSLPNYVGAFLLFIFPRVPAIYVLLWLQFMVQYGIGRFVAKKVGLTNFNADIAAFLYTTATPLVTQTIQQWLFGEVWAMSFMPLVLLGLYRVSKQFLFKNDETKRIDWSIIWPLAIGFALMLNCHVLSFAILIAYTAIFAVIVFIFGHNRLNLIVQMAVAALWAIGLSAGFLIPFLYNSLNNDLTSPQPYESLSYWAAPRAQEMISASYSFFSNTVGLIALLAVAVGFFLLFNKQITINLKLSYVTGVALTLAGTYYVWKPIYHTALGTIQFPHRVFAVAIFVLTIVLVMMIQQAVEKERVQKILLVGLVLISLFTLFTGARKHWLNQIRATSSEVNYVPSVNHKLPVMGSGVTFYTKSNTLDNLTKYWETFGAFDYLPKQFDLSEDLLLHHVEKESHVLVNTSYQSASNGIRYNGSFGQGKVILPFLHYHGDYLVTDQNKHALRFQIASNKQFVVETTNDTKKIIIQRKHSLIECVAYLINAIAFVVTVYYILVKWLKRKKGEI
ncbi:hypothetical protein NFX39_01070 [Fructobacillus sp. W13]|uniref:YfhO family protein n=1 Tax=Fructobacillus apis TaxID=2935017 RepID=A0ABT0ZNX0_9LACO|nr:hypothetical protein [Fructobacillus apis]MCO0831685.1 hypothetical protein [Fructobacillus apis]